MLFAWIFAALWNLISIPLPFLVFKEFTEKNNVAALFGLLFPLIGVGVLIFAIRRTLEWRRFGLAPVTLDPFPGSIGGHVGGTIDINLPYDASNQFSLTLTNLRSYVSGSGEDRSRKESAKWQDMQVAHTTTGSKGSKLSFRFDVPTELSESAADQSDDDYHIWRLNVKASLPGADINREYDIPVYATGQQSQHLSDFSIDKAKSEQKKIDSHEIEKLFLLKQDHTGTSLLFPMGRNLAASIFGLLFGSIFSGVAWLLIVRENTLFFGGLFGLVGSIIILAAFYSVLNSLEVSKGGGEIKAVRRVLGIAVKERAMHLSDFVRFNKKTTSTSQSGSKHVVYYSISAVDRNNERVVLGEGFKGVSQADAAAEFIGRTFGLETRETRPSERHTMTAEYNILTTE